jgi:hypothetical protein
MVGVRSHSIGRSKQQRAIAVTCLGAALRGRRFPVDPARHLKSRWECIGHPVAGGALPGWLRRAHAPLGVFIINRPPTLFDLRLVVIEPFNQSRGLVDTGQKK